MPACRLPKTSVNGPNGSPPATRAGAVMWNTTTASAATARSGSPAMKRTARSIPPVSERRQAVIDLGSNSFRLVVFTWAGHGHAAWWKRTDEIHEAVRVGEGLDASGELGAEPMERALGMLELYAHFCRATGITDVRAVATSAIRDASNQAEFLEAARQRTWLEVQVLEREEEARYGYLAAVNSTTLADGVALDIGGGSLQLSRVDGRIATDAQSWRLGAVRMTERFLDGKTTSSKQVKALRAHVEKKILSRADWLEGAGTHGR